jgi:hypothetical protein
MITSRRLAPAVGLNDADEWHSDRAFDIGDVHVDLPNPLHAMQSLLR